MEKLNLLKYITNGSIDQSKFKELEESLIELEKLKGTFLIISEYSYSKYSYSKNTTTYLSKDDSIKYLTDKIIKLEEELKIHKEDIGKQKELYDNLKDNINFIIKTYRWKKDIIRKIKELM